MFAVAQTIDSAYLSEWEAKWSRVAIEHTLTVNQATEHYVCVNYPGHNQLWIITKKGKKLLYDVRHGVGLFNNLDEQKPERQWQKKYGTVCQQDLERDLAMSRQLLYRLHVLVSGSTTLADAYAHAISAKSSDVGRNHLLDFTTGLAYHGRPTTYHVVFDRKTHLPQEIIGSWADAKETVEIAWSSSTKCRIDRVFTRGDEQPRHEVWNVLNISPLAHEPTDQSQNLAGGYYDFALTEFAKPVTSPGELVLDEREAARVLGAAKLGREYLAGSKFQTFDCGPESLYYLLALDGSVPGYRGVRELFPHPQYGTNLSEIARAARALGKNLTIAKVDSRKLSDVKLPCIISVTPSHFMVVVAIRDGKVCFINPPYKAAELPTAQVELVWNKYALWLGDAQ